MEECQKEFADLEEGVNSLSTTVLGRQFAHMCAGILLALDTQTRLYIVAPGDEYTGFCLLGARFSVWTGKFSADLPNSSLVSDFASFDIHYQALVNVAERLEALRFVGNIAGREMESMISASDIDTPEKLASLLKTISINDPRPKDSDRLLDELDKALRRTVFSRRYLPIQPDTIEQFFNFILRTDISSVDEEEELPIYFPSHDVDFSDPITRFLVAFGPEAPSPWNSAGEDMSVEQSEEYEVVDGKRKKTGRLDYYGNTPEQLIFAPKPTGISIKDWKNCIINKTVRMDMKERARAYRAVRVVHSDTRKRMWKSMILVVEKGIPESSRKGKGKEPEQKKKKVAPLEITVDDFLNSLVD